MKELQEVQKQIEFAQRSGVPPTQEQGEKFNAIRQKMEANSSVQDFMKAQQLFNTVMETVNNAIGKGITGEENQQ
ncbi:MAG: YlbF family regulator [Bacillota bacterium]|nr:YlbF family regulator [Bacillota bacterium]